ncbi:MAG: 1-(5-phosphoribosyl)-5-((5-phosphoribosylamino)methylideneamino)imidazole-4-carboxamide isomerase, partial [Candidatus Thiodiazotropha sp. (ex Codakia orbicularis)]|nr:1-(5-phosphoribosyl)-5-((5-phosphoribosylamino)methylideneamino)imidazole-4-carboxamide isomerase [Candidatus Thiodiazotropha sp. (ex Codakia orbicularis)]
DGMLSGPNIEATAALANAVSTPVIASGGITHIGDIEMLCRAETTNIMGAITGRAIYEGTLDLAEGQKLADEISG